MRAGDYNRFDARIPPENRRPLTEGIELRGSREGGPGARSPWHRKGAGDVAPLRGHRPPGVVPPEVVDDLLELQAPAGDLHDEGVPDACRGVRGDLVVEHRGVGDLGLPPEHEVPYVLARGLPPLPSGHARRRPSRRKSIPGGRLSKLSRAYRARYHSRRLGARFGDG